MLDNYHDMNKIIDYFKPITGSKQVNKEPMEIFVVRHGETDINKVGGNNLPETPLNENGILNKQLLLVNI